jgi:hypothetical protein
METNYYSKYLKYKNKYIQLKEHIGGVESIDEITNCGSKTMKINDVSGTYTINNNRIKNNIINFISKPSSVKSTKSTSQQINKPKKIDTCNICDKPKSYSVDRSCREIFVNNMLSCPDEKIKCLKKEEKEVLRMKKEEKEEKEREEQKKEEELQKVQNIIDNLDDNKIKKFNEYINAINKVIKKYNEIFNTEMNDDEIISENNNLISEYNKEISEIYKQINKSDVDIFNNIIKNNIENNIHQNKYVSNLILNNLIRKKMVEFSQYGLHHRIIPLNIFKNISKSNN